MKRLPSLSAIKDRITGTRSSSAAKARTEAPKEKKPATGMMKIFKKANGPRPPKPGDKKKKDVKETKD